ncbi:MAG: helix-turn-helix transcriptional regulator [Clostridia bacterium]|nr:helix-turn-helix transcriptional regulator [Clostridia bacterium]
MYVQRESCHKRINLLHLASDTAKSLYYYVQWVGHFITRSDFYIRRSGIESYLLLYTCEAGGTLIYGGRTYQLGARSVALLDCRCPHEYYPTNDGWDFKYVHFNGANSDALYRKICEDTCVFEVGREIEDLIDRIRTAVADAEGEEIASALIYRILMRLSRDGQNDGDWLKATLSYLSEHYAMPITVEGLADRVHLSRTYFSGEFKRRTGRTPHAYIEGYRVEAAKRRLETTNDSIAAIAAACGFSDSATFIRAFGRAVGETPLQYRRAKQKAMSPAP